LIPYLVHWGLLWPTWVISLQQRQLQWPLSTWGTLSQVALVHQLIGDYLVCPCGVLPKWIQYSPYKWVC
jgi:hypothetical protein